MMKKRDKSKTFLRSKLENIHENLNFVLFQLIMMSNSYNFCFFREKMATYPWGASTTHRISPSRRLGDARL